MGGTSTAAPNRGGFNKFAWLKQLMGQGLGPGPIAVGAVLFNLSDGDGTNAYPSLETIANLIDRGEGSARAYVRTLRTAGFIETRKRGNSHTPQSNVYRLTMPALEPNTTSRDRKHTDALTSRDRQRAEPRPLAGCAETVSGLTPTNPLTRSITNPPTPQPSVTASTQSPEGQEGKESEMNGMMTTDWLTATLPCTRDEAASIMHRLDADPATTHSADARISAWRAKHGDARPPFAASELRKLREESQAERRHLDKSLTDNGTATCGHGEPEGLLPTRAGKPRCWECRTAGIEAIDRNAHVRPA